MVGLGALLGSMLGFGATLAPEVIQMFKDHFSHQREIASKEQELTAIKEGYELDSPAPVVAPDEATEVLSVLKSSIRPVLTYAFFTLFVFVKLVALYNAYHVEHLPTPLALPLLWDEETETLFSAVITYWFGSRAFGKGKVNVESKSASGNNELGGSSEVVGE
jgi:hypothetical protein